MRTLWTYGCSHTDGFRKEENLIHSSRAYITLVGDDARINWTNHLAKKLNYQLNNQGESGVGNDYIFKQFCKTFHEIKKRDIVIVQWSYMNRFMFASPYDESTWFKVVPHTLLDYDNFSKQTQQEIMDNRDKPQWFVDIKNKMEMIIHLSKMMGFELYFWSADERILYNDVFTDVEQYCLMYNEIVGAGGFFEAMFLHGCKTIRQETNEIIPDPHLSIRGHEIVADRFYGAIRLDTSELI